MSDSDAAPIGAADTHDDAGHGHGGEPPGEPLGPVDMTAWAYALAGGAIGVVVVVALFVARSG